MSDFENKMLDATWALVWATAILSAVALWGDLIKRFFNVPKLVLDVENPNGEVTVMTEGDSSIDTRWFQVKVSNTNRKYPFHHVAMNLIEIQLRHPSGEWRSAWKGRAQMQWAGEPPTAVDRFPTKIVGAAWQADLFFIRADSSRFHLNIPIAPNSLSRVWPKDNAPSISVRFVVQARADEDESAETTFEAHWNGAWAADAPGGNPVSFKKVEPPAEVRG